MNIPETGHLKAYGLNWVKNTTNGGSMAAMRLVSPILVLGPAYSGKSRWAHALLETQNTHDPQKVQGKDHQPRQTLLIQTGPKAPQRLADPGLHDGVPSPSWEHHEAGLDLAGALIDRINPDTQILVDSINQWIGRLVSEEGPRGKAHVTDRIQDFLHHLSTKWESITSPKPLLILISSEVGASPPPYQDHERFFRQTIGMTNQALAQWAATVVSIQAGLSLILKAPP